MRKVLILFTFGCGMTMVMPVHADLSKVWDKRPSAQFNDSDGASQWWCSTWRTGDHVRMFAGYKFEGTLCVKNREELKWYDYLAFFKGKWKSLIEQDHKVSIEGTVNSQTTVLLGEGPNGEPLPKGESVQLVRSYECPMSSRGAAVIGLKDGLKAEEKVRRSYAAFYELMQDPAIKGKMEERWNSATKWVSALAKAGVAVLGETLNCHWMASYVPSVVGNLSQSLHDFASERAKKFYSESLARLNDGEFRDGGIEAKMGSPFYKKVNSEGVDSVINFATQINDLFMGRDFYIAALPGENPFARYLIQEGEAMECMKKCCKNRSLHSLPDKMSDIRPSTDEEKASGLIARESLNVNAKLFDTRKRRVGETWMTDANFLNHFLHPDLKGRFSGSLVLHYREDISLTLERARACDKRTYHVRHLEMVGGKEGEGKTYFEYREDEGFCMKSFGTDDSSLHIYQDKDSGYIVKVSFKGHGEVDMLPNMYLTSGWGFSSGRGDVSLLVSAEAVPVRMYKNETK